MSHRARKRRSRSQTELCGHRGSDHGCNVVDSSGRTKAGELANNFSEHGLMSSLFRRMALRHLEIPGRGLAVHGRVQGFRDRLWMDPSNAFLRGLGGHRHNAVYRKVHNRRHCDMPHVLGLASFVDLCSQMCRRCSQVSGTTVGCLQRHLGSRCGGAVVNFSTCNLCLDTLRGPQRSRVHEKGSVKCTCTVMDTTADYLAHAIADGIAIGA
jgi:hypothetical protein